MPEFFDHSGPEPELGIGEALENIVEIDQACRGGISQDAGSSGDPQTQCGGYPAAPFFVDNQQAGFPVLPSKVMAEASPGSRAYVSSKQGVASGTTTSHDCGAATNRRSASGALT